MSDTETPSNNPLQRLTLDSVFSSYVREESDEESETRFLNEYEALFDSVGIEHRDVSSSSGAELQYTATLRQYMTMSPNDDFLADEIYQDGEIITGLDDFDYSDNIVKSFVRARLTELRAELVAEGQRLARVGPTLPKGEQSKRRRGR